MEDLVGQIVKWTYDRFAVPFEIWCFADWILFPQKVLSKRTATFRAILGRARISLTTRFEASKRQAQSTCGIEISEQSKRNSLSKWLYVGDDVNNEKFWQQLSDVCKCALPWVGLCTPIIHENCYRQSSSLLASSKGIRATTSSMNNNRKNKNIERHVIDVKKEQKIGKKQECFMK